VTCLFPAGIGADIDIVFKIKYPQDLFTEMVDRTCATERDGGCEPGEGFSYYPPSISQITPVPPNAQGEAIEIMGADFGATASTVNITIGSKNCLDGRLTFDGRFSDATLTCDAQREVVGLQEVVVSVAEQKVVYDGYFEFVCKENFYAMEGEYCVECFKDPETGAYTSECKTRQSNPIALQGWYYQPLPVVNGKWNELCGIERSPPLVNATREEDGCPYQISCSVSISGETTEHRCKGGGGGKNQKEFPFISMAADNGNDLYAHPTVDGEVCTPISADWRIAKGTQICLECAKVNYNGKGPYSQCEKCQWQCGPEEEWAREEDARDKALFYTLGEYGNTCDRKYMGISCDECSPGHFKVNYQCDECPSNEWLYVILAFFVVAVGSTCCWFLTKYNVNLAILNIMVDFFQGISLFVRADVPWPAAVRQAMDLMSALNFNIEILGIECAVDFLYSEKFALKMVTPLVILGVILTTYLATLLIVKASKKFEWERTSQVLKHFELFDDACIGAYIIFFYFVYLELTRTALDVFNCENRIPSDGNTYMVSVKSEICGDEDGVQASLVPHAVIALLVYCVGFPCVLAFLLYSNREMIDKDMEMRALHLTRQRRQADHYPMTLRYARFYKYFKPSCKYWNIVIMGRKFFLAMTALLFRGNATFQLSIALLGMFVAFVLQIHYRPYWSVEEQQELVVQLRRKKNHDDVSDDVKQFMAMQQQMKAKAGGTGAMTGPRASELGAPKVETEEYEKVLQESNSLIFNLNTIEAVMLATTVVINLSGIMLSSGQFQDLQKTEKYQVNLITYVVLLAIGGCGLLLCVALGREVWLAKNIERNMNRARWRVAIKRQIKINNKKRARVKRFQDAVYQMMQMNGNNMQSVVDLQSDWKEREEDETSNNNKTSFGNFLKLFSSEKPPNSSVVTVAPIKDDPVEMRRQHEVEVAAQQEVMNADQVEQDERFQKKLDRKKKKRKKKKPSAVEPVDDAVDDAESIVPGAPSGPPAMETAGPMMETAGPVLDDVQSVDGEVVESELE
jgi:hypothetical protein